MLNSDPRLLLETSMLSVNVGCLRKTLLRGGEGDLGCGFFSFSCLSLETGGTDGVASEGGSIPASASARRSRLSRKEFPVDVSPGRGGGSMSIGDLDGVEGSWRLINQKRVKLSCH
jgi:hypothetical protein